MPAHESIHEYYVHQLRNINHYLELCMSFAEAELVHELRLSIKKLRAFHKLAEQVFPNEISGHIIKNRVLKLYRTAGQLRDTQVQIHLLNSFEEQTGIEYHEFRKWLLRREKKRILRFGRNPKHMLPHATAPITPEKIGNWLALASDETILNGASQVMTGLYKKATELTSGTMNDRDLHRIRTITKQLRYIYNIMHHSYPGFMFNKVSLDSLHEIEAAAGHWHDNLVRVELLGRFMEKIQFTDHSEMLKYQKLFDACNAELSIAYDEACRIVQSVLLPEQPGSAK